MKYELLLIMHNDVDVVVVQLVYNQTSLFVLLTLFDQILILSETETITDKWRWINIDVDVFVRFA